jgi:hypothetical protein
MVLPREYSWKVEWPRRLFLVNVPYPYRYLYSSLDLALPRARTAEKRSADSRDRVLEVWRHRRLTQSNVPPADEMLWARGRACDAAAGLLYGRDRGGASTRRMMKGVLELDLRQHGSTATNQPGRASPASSSHGNLNRNVAVRGRRSSYALAHYEVPI